MPDQNFFCPKHLRVMFLKLGLCASYLLLLVRSESKAENSPFPNPAFRPLNTGPVTLTDPTKLGRVIGGKEVKEAEVPYQVGVLMQGTGIWCGASVHSNSVILTAAHCFFASGKRVPDSAFVFAAGKRDLGTVEASEQLSTAKAIITHPAYDPVNGDHDIAVVKLKENLCPSARVQPIKLIGPGIQPTGTGRVSGWGYTLVRGYNQETKADAPQFSRILKMTELELISNATCVEKYKKVDSELYENLAKHATTLCAGSGGNDDACQGDSGGPLACLDSDGERVLCGIVSVGHGCGNPEYPAFYTDVSYLHDWIIQNAGPPQASCTF